jgi:hypothetical protein
MRADPDKISNEARRWYDFADDMTGIKQKTKNLYLGPLAFFPGGLGTEPGHYRKYKECLDAVTDRQEGGATEFELIGITLDNIATSYEEADEVNAQSFRVTEEELKRATEARSPPHRGGGGRWDYI